MDVYYATELFDLCLLAYLKAFKTISDSNIRNQCSSSANINVIGSVYG